MPIASHDSLSFSGVVWTLKLLHSINTETSMWCIRSFSSTF